MVNLIDKKGSQQKIGNKFTELFSQLRDPALNYTWFDFHGECKNMKWENLSKLVSIIEGDLQDHGYFMAQIDVGLDARAQMTEQTVRVMQEQKGVMRTNCMDCLDRTNVVQSVFSRKILHQQLFKLGVIQQPSGAPFEKFPINDLELAFRHVWTDNADAISILYTGTPALKTDFTRTGKRSQAGALNDGQNSLTRYYINNFTDGYNHDCLDLSQGRITPQTQLVKRGYVGAIKLQLLGILGLLYVAQMLLHTYLPYPAEGEDGESRVWALHTMVYSGVVLAGLSRIYSNGKDFCDLPSRFV